MSAVLLESSALSVFGAFAGKAVLIMTLIALSAVLTPYIARLIDGKNKNDNNKSSDDKAMKKEISAEEYEVKGVFESDKDDSFDPNYKIYNTDIYGVEKYNGKKQ